MRISDWSADVCSSDLSILCWIAFVVASSLCSIGAVVALPISHHATHWFVRRWTRFHRLICRFILGHRIVVEGAMPDIPVLYVFKHEGAFETIEQPMRSEEHTSELQSLMRISYAVFCLTKKKQ